MEFDTDLLIFVLWLLTMLSVQKGVSAFWKGAVPTAMGMAAENAMAFGINEMLKRAFPDDPHPTSTTDDKNSRPPNLVKPFLMVGSLKFARDRQALESNDFRTKHGTDLSYLLIAVLLP
jgi:hypothetical protein